jgi:serine/threonine-protein kinase
MTHNLIDEKEVFNCARRLAVPEERVAYLQHACGHEPKVLHRIQELLRVHDQESSFLESPAVAPAATSDAPNVTERPGTVIGPYKLLEQIGEGGMGLVFVAEQQHPVRRRVALKIIKPGMDSRQVVARFESERQALAMMDHPNIAKVFDGGTVGSRQSAVGSEENALPTAYCQLPTGDRPYFVMELVKGTPITEYCDKHRLTTRDRLQLFMDVCHAVQHAHQKGIIHRDIKPSNVLVEIHDVKPVVKVIDFGVAKAMGEQLTDKTLYTVASQMVGTPLYMSPEQAGLSSLDVDTRSDVYSLGVLLYELLTGTTPFDSETLKKAGYDEMRRIIREDEPPRPSARLSTMQQAHLSTIAEQRGLEPHRLSQHLRGDLDWIVMKALEKDRNRRYESASAFAADVQHYLNDEPVLAFPPSVAYRLRKYARRHRTRLAVVVLLGLVLLAVVGVGGGVGLWWTRKRATAEGEARTALREADELQGRERWHEALSAARRAEGVLAGVGTDSNLWQQVQESIADLEMARRLQEARLSVTASKDSGFDREAGDAAYASAFQLYGLDVDEVSPTAAAERIQAATIRRQLVAALDDWADIKGRRTPGCRQRLAMARAADPDPWRNRLRDCFETRDTTGLDELIAAAEIADWPVETLLLLIPPAHNTASAEKVALVLARAQERHPGDFWINLALGEFLRTMRPPKPAEAIRYHSIAVALQPESAGAHNKLGVALKGSGRLDEAISQYREAIHLDKDNPGLHTNLGAALQEKGHLDEAIAQYREAIHLDTDNPGLHTNLGLALQEKGWPDQAIDEHNKAIELDPKSAAAYSNLSLALAEKDRLDEAITAAQTAIKLDRDFWHAYINLGRALGRKGRLEESIAASRKAIELNPDEPDAYDNLGAGLQRSGRLNEAIVAHRKAIELRPQHFGAHYNLGNALEKKDMQNEALAAYRKAIESKPDFAEAHCNLGRLLQRMGVLDEALKELRRGHELGTRQPNWRFPSATWVQEVVGLKQLDERLPGVLEGKSRPKDVADCLAFAELCAAYKHYYYAAVRFYEEAFVKQPDLASDLKSGNRYFAASVAALAGCRQGKDADRTDDKERTRLRRQAISWLRDELAAWRQLLGKGPDKMRAVVEQKMKSWQQDTDFAGVRGPEAISKLPEDERQAWQKLWQEVEALRNSVLEPAKKAGQ